MLKLKMTDNGLMAIDKDGSLCRIVSEKSNNQILNNSRSYLDRLNSDFMESVAKAKALSIPDSFNKLVQDYAIQGELILKAEYDRLVNYAFHYPINHSRFLKPKKSKKQKQKEKIDRLERELKEARDVICSQSVEIHRLKHKEAILIEHQQTTANDSPKTKANTGREAGQKINNETKELLYNFWVKNGCQGSGQFEATMKRKLDKTEVVDGLILVFDDELPFTSRNEAKGYRAEFSKKEMLFSGLATVLTGFKKRFEQASK